MPRTGRPPLLDPQRQQRIINALVAGSSRTDAAAYAGIAYATLKRWLQRGRDCAERNAERIEANDIPDHATEAEVLDDPDWVFYAFAVAVEEAEARATITALGTVSNSIRDEEDKHLALKAATWYLRYQQDRKTLAEVTDAQADDETLRAEGYALIEEIRRRDRAAEEETA